jgi:recombination protein RecA
MFGNPETTTGGNALKFYASVRCDIRRISALKQGEQVVGSRTRVRVVKNKVAPPFREAEFDIIYGIGINKTGELIDLGAELGVIEKSGSWFSYAGDRIGQGRDNACDFLRENPKISMEIEARLRQSLGLPHAPVSLSVVEGGIREATGEAAGEHDEASAEKARAVKKARAGK